MILNESENKLVYFRQMKTSKWKQQYDSKTDILINTFVKIVSINTYKEFKLILFIKIHTSRKNKHSIPLVSCQNLSTILIAKCYRVQAK